jgi:hypothetical protein
LPRPGLNPGRFILNSAPEEARELSRKVSFQRKGAKEVRFVVWCLRFMVNSKPKIPNSSFAPLRLCVEIKFAEGRKPAMNWFGPLANSAKLDILDELIIR